MLMLYISQVQLQTIVGVSSMELLGQAPVVQTLDSAIHWINHYPLDNSIGFASVYPLDSDLSGGQRYPSFEQLGPGVNQSYLQWTQAGAFHKISICRIAEWTSWSFVWPCRREAPR